MKINIRSFLPIILILFTWQMLSGQTGPAAMLPEDENLQGWIKRGEVKVWRKENIRNFAKNESDIVLEYGFNYAVEQNYIDAGNDLINVKVYVMYNSFGSCGLFMRSGKNQKIVKGYGNSAYQKEMEYAFWKHLYFVKISAVTAGGSVEKGMKMIASFIDSKIKSKGTTPEILDLAQGKTGAVTIFRGPLVLSEIYNFSPQNIFFIEEGIAIESGKRKEIFLKYTDRNEAVRHFTEAAGLLSRINKFYDFKMPDNFSFSMKDRDSRKLVFSVSDNYLNITID
jgi:hypothetical protein